MLCKQPALLTLVGLGAHAAWNAWRGDHLQPRSRRLLALIKSDSLLSDVPESQP